MFYYFYLLVLGFNKAPAHILSLASSLYLSEAVVGDYTLCPFQGRETLCSTSSPILKYWIEVVQTYNDYGM